MLFPAAKVLMSLTDTVFVAPCDLDLQLYFHLFSSVKHHNNSMGVLWFGVVFGGFFSHPTQNCVCGTHRKGLTSISILALFLG